MAPDFQVNSTYSNQDYERAVRCRNLRSFVLERTKKQLSYEHARFRRQDVAVKWSEFKELNQNFPNIFLRTQFITGFPGETPDQFKDTCNLLDELYFDYTEVYPYSPRPNTLAATFDNQIPIKERLRRRNKLWLKSLLKKSPQKLKKIYATL